MSGALVGGVGMVKFSKPGAQAPYPQMASDAIRVALADAGLQLGECLEHFGAFQGLGK